MDRPNKLIKARNSNPSRICPDIARDGESTAYHQDGEAAHQGRRPEEVHVFPDGGGDEEGEGGRREVGRRRVTERNGICHKDDRDVD